MDRLVREVRSQEPYSLPDGSFGSCTTAPLTEARKAPTVLRDKWPNAILIHTPVHASWLSQVEIYFSIVQPEGPHAQRFSSLAELEQRLPAFQSHYERTTSPFKWTFTRRDLHTLLAKIAPTGWLPPLDVIRHSNSEREY